MNSKSGMKIVRVMSFLVSMVVLVGIVTSSRQPLSSQEPLPLPPEGTAEPTPKTKKTPIPQPTYDVVVNEELYAPARYGIPDTIAGYNVLAVLAPDNTMCMPEGTMRIVVQVVEKTMDDYLASNTSEDIYKALEGLNVSVDLHVVGPGVVKETLLTENEKWNINSRSDGCIQLGGPFPTPENH